MALKPIYHHAASSQLQELDGRKLILSVADDQGVLFRRYQLMTAAGYAVVSASDAAQALELFGCWRPDLVVLNYKLPNLNGDVTAEAIKAHTPRMPIIMIVSDLEIVGRCSRVVDRFLFEADGPERLLRTISNLFESEASR